METLGPFKGIYRIVPAETFRNGQGHKVVHVPLKLEVLSKRARVKGMGQLSM